ncbi:lipopolysaccharide core heptose(II) kinase RfaY [uncultured Fusobacterium sp.]|uniref:lipopolysaccharide core heptose(II) kinase RfaY n=1 Tax=uncultured Fusobacterium sp. TaxID=159267 RepID=UPI00265F16EF|nr:lipopolysaccharide core heptose(II) kinase RfaY [uncultured Fusobacterium sp.]
MKNKKYLEWQIYFLEEENNTEILGELILNNKYIIKKVFKDTERNYVAQIEIENKYYILKEFRSEIIIPQRKIQTLLKKGEALSTLINTTEAIELGIEELVKPIIALVKKRGTIKKSYLLMEYIEGTKISTIEDIDKIMNLVEKMHKIGIYHGDLNTSNFLKENDKVRILDTQGKKEKIGSFKRWYDILTLENDNLVKELNYNVREKYYLKEKDAWFYLAYLLKNFKNTKLIKKIKAKKKELRKKGWKI